MQETKSWKLVGKVKDAHGLTGELHILLFAGESSWASRLKEFGLAKVEGDTPKVYPLKSCRPHKEGLLVRVNEIQDRTQAEAYKGQLFFIPEELLVSKKGERIFLAEVLHFEVLDDGKLLGTVESFSSNGPQDLLVINYQGKTIEIPFVEAFILGIDFAKKQILMKLPEGLLEISEA